MSAAAVLLGGDVLPADLLNQMQTIVSDDPAPTTPTDSA